MAARNGSKKKNHYQGRKWIGRHTTLTDFGKEIVLLAEKMTEVTGIRSGRFFSNLKPASRRHIKVMSVEGQEKSLLLKIRSSTSLQEITLTCTNVEEVRRAFEQLKV